MISSATKSQQLYVQVISFNVNNLNNAFQGHGFVIIMPIVLMDLMKWKIVQSVLNSDAEMAYV